MSSAKPHIYCALTSSNIILTFQNRKLQAPSSPIQLENRFESQYKLKFDPKFSNFPAPDVLTEQDIQLC